MYLADPWITIYPNFFGSYYSCLILLGLGHLYRKCLWRMHRHPSKDQCRLTDHQNAHSFSSGRYWVSHGPPNRRRSSWVGWFIASADLSFFHHQLAFQAIFLFSNSILMSSWRRRSGHPWLPKRWKLPSVFCRTQPKMSQARVLRYKRC